MARITTNVLGGGTIGYALPLGPEEAQAEWAIWMWNNGGDWKKGDRWAINSDQNVQTLQFLAERGVKVAVVLLEASTFGGSENSLMVFGTLAASDIYTYLVRRSEDLISSLSLGFEASDALPKRAEA